jgi:hypothetical protein
MLFAEAIQELCAQRNKTEEQWKTAGAEDDHKSIG